MAKNKNNPILIEEDFIVTIREIAQYEGCVAGWKLWCDIQGISFKDVIKNGIKASVLVKSGDFRALQIVNDLKIKRN